MKNSRIVKLLLLMIVVVVPNVIVFSPGLVGLEIGEGSALQMASGITLLVISILVLLYGSYQLLFKPPVIMVRFQHDMSNPEEYIAALQSYKHVKVLKKDTSFAIDQLERIEKKKSLLLEVLGRRFEPTELSYQRFRSVISEVEKLFYLNVRGILTKLSIFDAAEFTAFTSQQGRPQISDRLVRQKTELYNEYLAFVTGYLGANEEILLKLDKLLLEISQLGNVGYKDIDEMPCMQEIDALIKQTKFYKQ